MRIFNRTRICVLLAAVMLCAQVTATAEMEINWAGQRIDSELFSGSLNAVCVDGEDVYVLSGGELWSCDADMNRLEFMHTFAEPLCGFAVSDGVFYYAFVEDGRTCFARLTKDGDAERLFDTDAERSMFRMVVTEQTIVSLWRYTARELSEMEESRACEVRAYSLDGSRRSLDVERATDVAVLPGRGVVCINDVWTGTTPFYVLDVQTGHSAPMDEGMEGSSLAISPDGSAFYVCDAQVVSSARAAWASAMV